MNTINKKEEKNKENEIIKDIRLWDLKKTSSTEKILPAVNSHLDIIKQYTDTLLEEEKEQKIKKNYDYNLKNLKRSYSTDSYRRISSHAKNLLYKIGKNVKYIKNTNDKIRDLNELYMNHTSKDYFNFDYLDNDNKDSNNTFNNSTFFICKNNNNNKRIKNFSYVTDNYRKQLKNAFMKFNPYSHLENLHLLEKSDPFIQKDINILKKAIDVDIMNVTDRHKLKKKYENIRRKNLKSQSSDNIINIKEQPKKKKKRKSLKDKYLSKKPFNFFFNKGKKGVKGNLIKEEKIEELNKILNCTDSINNIIDDNYINDNIEKAVNEYNKKKYNENYKSQFLNNDPFFQKKNEVINTFKDFYSYKINKMYNENEKKTLYNVNKENEYFSKKILYLKDSFLNDFNSYLEKEGINLNLVPFQNDINLNKIMPKK